LAQIYLNFKSSSADQGIRGALDSLK